MLLHLQIALAGTSGIDFMPLAHATQIALSGRWPHPSFHGRFLPITWAVNDRGFRAQWRVSEPASDAPGAFLERARDNDRCESMKAERFGVQVVQPVDVYVQSLRAVNYGFLFIGLIFVVFLHFELLATLQLHAMQYALVELALAAFLLLLFAMAEHLQFVQAYLIAAVARISRISFYVRHLLRSALGVLLLGVLLLGVQLLGALRVFPVLALTMVLTRRMDWSRIGDARARPDGPEGRCRADGPVDAA